MQKYMQTHMPVVYYDIYMLIYIFTFACVETHIYIYISKYNYTQHDTRHLAAIL